MRGWTVRDCMELYNVPTWGAGFFSVNAKGHVEVQPRPDGPSIDLLDLVQDLQQRGLRTPLLMRFSDILASARAGPVRRPSTAPSASTATAARYRGVYPIKVNQQRHVVEEIVEYGAPHDIGLEAGSKPELLIALAMLRDAGRADHLQRLQGREVHRDGAARRSGSAARRSSSSTASTRST